MVFMFHFITFNFFNTLFCSFKLNLLYATNKLITVQTHLKY